MFIFSGLFSKAKGRILGKHEEYKYPSSDDNNEVGSSHVHEIIWEPQEIGVQQHFVFDCDLVCMALLRKKMLF